MRYKVAMITIRLNVTSSFGRRRIHFNWAASISFDKLSASHTMLHSSCWENSPIYTEHTFHNRTTCIRRGGSILVTAQQWSESLMCCVMPIAQPPSWSCCFIKLVSKEEWTGVSTFIQYSLPSNKSFSPFNIPAFVHLWVWTQFGTRKRNWNQRKLCSTMIYVGSFVNSRSMGTNKAKILKFRGFIYRPLPPKQTKISSERVFKKWNQSIFHWKKLRFQKRKNF